MMNLKYSNVRYRILTFRYKKLIRKSSVEFLKHSIIFSRNEIRITYSNKMVHPKNVR